MNIQLSVIYFLYHWSLTMCIVFSFHNKFTGRYHLPISLIISLGKTPWIGIIKQRGECLWPSRWSVGSRFPFQQ